MRPFSRLVRCLIVLGIVVCGLGLLPAQRGAAATRALVAGVPGHPAAELQAPDFVPTANPSVSGTTPVTGTMFIRRDVFIAATVNLPNVGAGVDRGTLSAATVALVRNFDGMAVAANLNTSAAGDIIVLDPLAILDPFTAYTFSVTGGLHDTSGASFEPFSMTFTTGSAGGPVASGQVKFEQVALPDTAHPSGGYTTLTFGPDGKLYATTADGLIVRFVINPDGTTGVSQTLNALQTANGGRRLLVGLAFDPGATADNLIAWVSHSYYTFGNGPDWTGKISRMSGPDLGQVQDYVVGLPRSTKDHVSNSVVFGPDGAIYMPQGSTSSMGAADPIWNNRPEHLLNAAILRVDAAAIASPPLNVKTEGDGAYDPWAEGAPLTIYASGVRNAYDLVWHSNGQLYAPTNGGANGGNTPGTPADVANYAPCQHRIDKAGAGDYVAPQVTGLVSATTQPDFLFRIVGGGYYGHPNATRCEWVMNGGKPGATADSSRGEVREYPQGTQPDRNWRGFAYRFGISYSPDGAIEYRSDTFNGALRGKLLVVRYSGGNDIIALTPGGDNLDIVEAKTNIYGFTGFNDPLDLVENRGNGFLYVSEYGAQRITLLRPIISPSPVANIAPERQIYHGRQSAGAGTTQTFTLSNTGSIPLTITSLLLSGPDASQFALVNPPALPFALAPGAAAPIGVAFNPSLAGPLGAILQVGTNDPATPTIEGRLRGLSTSAAEPSLQWILDSYELPVGTGDDNPATTAIHSSQPSAPLLGQEVASQQFAKAESGPVSIEVLASFGPANGGSAVAAGWYPAWQPAGARELWADADTSGHELEPQSAGPIAFDPGSAVFGLYGSWPQLGGRSVYGQDALNAFAGALPHQIRAYPLRDSTGSVVPNAYVVAIEAGGDGPAYQDLVLILRNVRPAAALRAIYIPLVSRS